MNRWLPTAVLVVPAAAIGGYLGYSAGYVASQGGLTGIGAILIVLLAVGLAMILVLVGLVLRAIARWRRLARALLIAAVVLAAAGTAGYAAVPTFGLGYRPPIVREATGSASVELAAVDGFATSGTSDADCTSIADGLAAGLIFAGNLGELRDGTLRASLYPGGPGRPSRIELFIDAADVPEGSMVPSWGGEVEVIEQSGDSTSGRVRFDDLPIFVDEKIGPPDSSWPATLSGVFSWACEAWLDPRATVPPPAGGGLRLELPGLDIRLDQAGRVTCDFEKDSAVAGLTSLGSYRLQDWPLSVSIDLGGEPRIGDMVRVMIGLFSKEPPPGLEYAPSWEGLALVEDLDAGEATGQVRLDELPAGIDPSIGPPPTGWPVALTGTIAWTCA